MKRKAPNSGELWTAKEEALLVEGFDLGFKLPDLCARLGRSEAAILTRLVRLKKLVFIPAQLKYYCTKVWWRVP